MKFATNPVRHCPPYCRHVATLPLEIKKNQIFCSYSSDVEENENIAF